MKIPFEQLTESQQEPWISLATECLNDLYACTRVWEAWGYGTMTQDDFHLADQDCDIVYDVACRIYSAMPLPQPS